MRLRINGKEHDVEGVTNIEELLHHFGLGGKILVVEHNRAIVSRDAYDSVTLAEGDQLEIVHFVGGG